jgi:hypothetical protein
MVSRLLSICLALLVSAPALAQKEVIFGSGKPAPYQEEDLDRRFLKSKINRVLSQGTQDANCSQLAAGLFTVLAEIAPFLHKRDQQFFVDEHVLAAVNTQLTTQRFPATAYLAAMVRRVMLDGKLPDSWLANAEALNQKAMIIDIAKLRYLNKGVVPIDSFMFSLPTLRERYDLEVARANSLAKGEAGAVFRDAYLDREVAWGGAYLVEVGAAKSSKRGRQAAPDELVAIMEWSPPQPQQHQLLIHAMPNKAPPVKIIAKLAPRQFVDLGKVPRGKRMLIKGRFWEMNRSATEVELRDALLFEDRDFSQGLVLANPEAVFACPSASNELTMQGPKQPGGFGH